MKNEYKETVEKMVENISHLSGANDKEAKNIYAKMNYLFGEVLENDRADVFVKFMEELDKRGIPFNREFAAA